MECVNNTTDTGRGMVMYLQSDLDYNLQDLDQPGYTEAQVVEVKLDRGQKVVIASVYRSPNSSPENNQQLNALIRQIGAQPSDFKIILGDFNFP
jgi:endonuclease/exonuclease/phosphatase family metal-dependent hydrolase